MGVACKEHSSEVNAPGQGPLWEVGCYHPGVWWWVLGKSDLAGDGKEDMGI